MNLTETKENKNKGIIKRVTALAMCAMMTVSCCSITASAATKSVYESGNVFTYSWEKTKTWNCGSVKLKYGFNTWCTNEVYCKSYNSNVKHYAYVSSGGKKDTASGKKEKWYSKAEVPHASGTVTWGTTY